MDKALEKRLIRFLWGFGGFCAVAVASYLININDIREIDTYKLLTILIVSASGYIVNQGTKFWKTGK
jgi:hypothetical protein